ncbi:hypothetical protein [Amycolatopsis sp. NPDC004079]|uniref:hypothetical protein n=1 Tax=Amycolatopsis sp. NPDC004079 TaxID=3154549 RepID=UPI0033B3CB98
MTRGKRARARTAQDQRRLQEEIRQLRTEIELETARAAEARAGAERAARARRLLAEERRATDARLARYVAEAARRADGAVRTRDQLARALRKVRAADDNLTGAVATPDSFDQARQAGLPMTIPAVHRSAGNDYKKLWYRKKSGADLDLTRQVSLEGWVPEGTEDTVASHGRYALSRPGDTHPEACWTWAVPPWMRIPDGTGDAPALRARLGAVTTGAPRLPDTAYPGPGLRPDAVFHAPWRLPPLIGHPADALDQLHWYRRSAWAQDWQPGREPVPMWLPTEHCSGFPAARPLPEGVDVRLPFPTVYAALSTPWTLEPNPEAAHPLLNAHPLFAYARGKLGTDLDPPTLATVLSRLQATGLDDRSELPSPLEFLDGYGGAVEGVLLTADDRGVPGDDIAWCMSIHHPMGMPLARIAIPASRARSRWRRQLDNLVAGIALSCWHEARALPPRLSDRAAGIGPSAIADPGDLHVLDIDATSPRRAHPGPDDPGDGPGVRAHLRRGHWRDQHVGPGRRARRWTWVRSAAVHGGLDGGGQVYVLRDRDAARSDSS